MSVAGFLKREGKGFKEKENEIWVEIEKKRLHRVLESLKMMEVERISCISGIDTGKEIQVIYHLHYSGGLLNLRVKLPREKPRIKTITEIYPGAILFERELMEMLGIQIDGHPEPKPLFLDKESPSTPLRKD